MIDEKATELISILEQTKASLHNADDSIKSENEYLKALSVLASSYYSSKDYQKSLECNLELLNCLWEEHRLKHGSRLSKDNIDLVSSSAHTIIDLYQNIGLAYSRLNNYPEARTYFEQGYFISFYNLGEYHEKTLKLQYNLVINELMQFEQREALRQLAYLTADLIQYLGADHEYTKKALSIINNNQ